MQVSHGGVVGINRCDASTSWFARAWRILNNETHGTVLCHGFLLIGTLDENEQRKRLDMDLSIFTTPEAWISLIALIFLEIVLGIDNLVFISITTNRLPEEKRHLGRKLGLAGALVMRILFLSLAFVLIHLTNPLFTLEFGSYSHGISVSDIVLLAGGAYLIYKGIVELRDVLQLTEPKAERSQEHKKLHQIAMPQAIATIMIMDIVFSIDSVITAVALADHLIIMIIAVMLAVFLMMLFIDPIADFIDRHPEMKILALVFISTIGVLLVLESLGLHTGIEMMGISFEKLMVYFAMIFAFVLELIQMAYNRNYNKWRKEIWKTETAEQVNRVREEMIENLKAEKKHQEEQAAAGMPEPAPGSIPNITPVFIGSNVYIMMPVEGEDTASFKDMIQNAAISQGRFLEQPIEIDQKDVEVSDKTSDSDSKTAESE
jgi:predicted tellurium resistance membrane protein TerC